MSVDFEVIDSQEAWSIFDETSKRLLHLDGSEFARLWDAGEFATSDSTDVMRVAMLRPSGGE